MSTLEKPRQLGLLEEDPEDPGVDLDDAPAVVEAEVDDGDEGLAVYAEVAVPVPLRRLFTYRLPAKLAGLSVGARVAVPFGPRKIAGVVVSVGVAKPEGVRIRAIAGVVDPDPIFTPELMSFLRESADYYLHPVGEVFRAASPAMSADALKTLRDEGFLDSTGDLKGSRVKDRTELWVCLEPAPEVQAHDGRVGAKQVAVVAALEAAPDHEMSAEALLATVGASAATLKSLASKGRVRLEARAVQRDPFFGRSVALETAPVAGAAQADAIAAICASIDAKVAQPFLLHGVTGSGKTEVYLRVIEYARERALGALVLVPEISLTPQLVSRFRARFGDAIACLHSGLSDRERLASWRRLRNREVHLAIGARSALFAPVCDLGIIVVDEEHDPSFKQEEGFRYSARDLALLRAKRANAVCVLGSATPSVESYWNAQNKRYTLLPMPERATQALLPQVEIVDLARNMDTPSGHPLLTAPLHRALEKCLEQEEQAILFLNRRGFAPSMRCVTCGAVRRCPACSVGLTEHRREALLRCHYCDFSTGMTSACSECGKNEFEAMGVGTERVEDVLEKVFPSARIGRLDRDSATGLGVEAVLDKLRKHEIDILVGTQMVTKGHDVANVTLVGVLVADQSLVFPDFRAAERTFQLLAQVAGRAGRGQKPGRVLLQTWQPDHPAIQRAAHHDYEGFYKAEIEDRRDCAYSPFARLAAVRLDAGDEPTARRSIGLLAEVVKKHPITKSGAVQLLGPAPAPIERLRGRFRFRMLLRSRERAPLRTVMLAVMKRIEDGISPARATIDIDPVSML